MKIFLILTISILSSHVSSNPGGWLWYKDPFIPKKEDPKNQEKKVLTAKEKTDVIKKSFEEATSKAVINPTYENVLLVQRLQTQMIDQSEKFQEMWSWVVQQDGNNFRKESHGNRVHREVLKEENKKDSVKKLKKLAKTYGLFLFFKQNCPYCHSFAPLVKSFSETYGFSVKAISSDGGKLAAFPSSVLDNGTLRKLNPEGIFPALFLVNPTTGEVIPLSWGMNSLSVLEEHSTRIYDHLEKTR